MSDLKVAPHKPLAFKSRVEFVSNEAREFAPQIRKLINHIKHHTESNKYTYNINAGKEFLTVDTFLYAEKKGDIVQSYYRGLSKVGGTKDSQVDYIIENIKSLKEAREAYEFQAAAANKDAVLKVVKKTPNKFVKWIKSFIKNW